MGTSNNKPIIFLAFANDRSGTVGQPLNLPDEERRVREKLEAAERHCEFVARSNCTADDIFKVLQDAKYRDQIAIFHYSGHADSYHLLLETRDGKATAADASGLASFLAAQHGLRLVVLNGCSTRQQARGLLDANKNLIAVIATSRAIDDAVAIHFSTQFYAALAQGAKLRTAFNEAGAAIRTTRGSDHRKLYFGDADKNLADDNRSSDGVPWELYEREGSSEIVDQWSLPDVANDPLFGLPPLDETKLPESPYKHLNLFTHDDAEIFFGRGREIRQLYDALTSGTQPIVLFYGQSGVGKSSLLDAGVLPRLTKSCEVRYARRGDRGLLATLQGELGLAANDPTAIETAWLATEAELDKPLVVILDQVEEFYTRPMDDLPGELDELLQAAKATFGNSAHRPRGKLVLGFREEWLAKLEDQVKVLPLTKIFLKRLDRAGILEVVQGPTRGRRLRERYALTIEDGLAEEIADDLLADRGSAIATTLQILLFKLWEKATEIRSEPPTFTRDLYLDLKGKVLGDFFNQQLQAFEDRMPEPAESGLLLDVLAQHTTSLGTANQSTREQLLEQYSHVNNILRDLLQHCQDLHLLTVPTKQSSQTTRLAHDTLAPLVREQFDTSDKPGQRARRILDNRSVDWQKGRTGAPLDETDLKVVEQGLAGTLALTATEVKLVNVSRVQRAKKLRNRRIGWTFVAAALTIITYSASYAYWMDSMARKNAQFALHGSFNAALSDAAADWRFEPLEGLSNLNDDNRCPKSYRDEFTWCYLHRVSGRTSAPIFPKNGVLPTTTVALAPGDSFQIAWCEGTVVEPGKVRYEILRWKPGMNQPEAIPGVTLDEDVAAMTFSSDGVFLSWHSRSQRPVIWNIAESRPSPVSEELAPNDWTAAAFSPVSPHLAYTSGEALHVIDWNDKTPLHEPVPFDQLRPQPSEIIRTVFSADGRVVFVLSEAHDTHSFASVSLEDTSRVTPFEGRFVCCSPNGKHVLVAAKSLFSNVPAKLVDFSGGAPVDSTLPPIGQKGVAQPTAASFSRDGTRLVVAYQDLDLPGSIAIWDTVTITPLARLPGSISPREDFLFVAFADDSSFFTSSRFGWDSTEDRRHIRLWDAITDGLPLQMPPIPTNTGPHSANKVGSAVAFSRQGHQVAAVINGELAFWDSSTGKLLNNPSSPTAPVARENEGAREGVFTSARALAFSRDGRRMIDDRGHVAQISSDVGGTEVSHFYPTLASNGQRSVAVVDGQVGLRDTEPDRYGLITLPLLAADIESVCIAPSGDIIACLLRTSKDGAGNLSQGHVFVRGTGSTDTWNEVPLGGANPTAIAFSPDSMMLGIALTSGSSSIVLWSVKKRLSASPVTRTDPTNGRINALTFSPNGKTLASASDGPGYGYAGGYGGVVRLWDPVTGQLRLALSGHSSGAKALAFSPDSRKLASCSDNEVILWDSAEWQPPYGLGKSIASSRDTLRSNSN